ncbi:MAG TPA: ATP-grasp domain-containing protein [Flavisolibacter sp.]
MSSKINILMTGAGAPGAAGIIYCLKSDPSVELTVADANENAVGKYLAKDFVQIPKANHPAFISALLDICLEKHIDIILPLVTRELFPLSQNKKRFEEKGIRVLVSHPGAIDLANNKSSSYRYLKEAGIEVPKFFVVKNVEEFIHAAYELGHPQRSFCFKPSISNGSRGVRIVSDSLDESELLFHEKPYNLQITYAHALHILSSHPFPELLVSEYLPGPEFSVDCLVENGEVHLAVPRLRKKMINGISVEGEFVKDTAVIDYCKSIIRAIGLHGNIGIQVKMSENEVPMLLEINPRVQGTIVAGMGAGVNLPLLAIKQELNLPIEQEELEVRWGVKFSRYWAEVYY